MGEENADCPKNRKQDSGGCRDIYDLARLWNSGAREYKSEPFLRQFWERIGRFDQRIAHRDDYERQSARYYYFFDFFFRVTIFIFRPYFASQFESRPEPQRLREVQTISCTNLFRYPGIQAIKWVDDFGCPEWHRPEFDDRTGGAHHFVAAGERESHRRANGNI